MNFNNLDDIKNAWMQGKFNFPKTMTVNDIEYHYRSSSNQSFEAVITENAKAYMTYATSIKHREQAKQAGLNQWIAFVWEAVNHKAVVPNDVFSISPHRFITGENVKGEFMREQVETIGDVVIVKIELPSGPAAMKGKVDTGAEISSLHAGDIKINGDQVKFTNKELSNNVITAPVADKQAVQSADGGVEYRPVIKINCEINGKRVSGVMFNLNDRSKMEYGCLIGQNVLEKTGFLVDPRQDGPTKGPSKGADTNNDQPEHQQPAMSQSPIGESIDDVWINDDQDVDMRIFEQYIYEKYKETENGNR